MISLLMKLLIRPVSSVIQRDLPTGSTTGSVMPGSEETAGALGLGLQAATAITKTFTVRLRFQLGFFLDRSFVHVELSSDCDLLIRAFQFLSYLLPIMGGLIAECVAFNHTIHQFSHVVLRVSFLHNLLLLFLCLT